ncbi:cobalt ECF transporter T component CbiQ [Candidatus Latescibacterota bacterium]
MHHIHIDRFAGMSSPVHSLDPRNKLLSTLVFIIAVVLTPDSYFFSFIVYIGFMLFLIYLSHVPILFILKRSLTLVPFAIAVSLFVPFITPGQALWEFSFGPFGTSITDNGLIRFISIGFKAFISFFATITLVSSTRFGDLMRAAGKLGLPTKMVVILSFMYRYLFILIDEAAHMVLARDIRGSGQKRIPLLAATGSIIGALFIRSYEHAEKLYYAMLIRGYSGKPVTLNPMKLTVKDAVFPLAVLGIVTFGIAAGRFMNG